MATLRRVLYIASLLIILLIVAYPWFTDQYGTDLMTQALLYALFTMSVDLLWGYTGILNLAPAMYFGLGAYSYALSLRLLPGSWSALAGLVLAVLIPILLSLAIGYTSFRARSTEIYFALITLAIGLAVEKIILVSYNFTGGSNGITGVAHPVFWGLSLQDPKTYYYVVATLVVLASWFSYRLVGSPFGRVLRAIRANELRAQALGYNTTTYKLLIFGFSAAMGGAAGALTTPLTSMAHPSQLSVPLSVQAYVGVAVGGQGTLIGPVLAAIGINLLESWLSGLSATTHLLGLGFIFLLVVLFFPSGLAGTILRQVGTLAETKPPTHADRTPGAEPATKGVDRS